MTQAAYYFCGIGGSGMSPLARLLAARGQRVLGSDRSYDQGKNAAFFETLRSEGIQLVPQDGSGLSSAIGSFVVTRAVEESIPDIARARQLGLRVVKRPQLMAELFQDSFNIAVGGTSGKSTTTGMIGHVLTRLGRAPTIVNGAVMRDYSSSFVNGIKQLAVFEADESDGLQDVVALCPRSVAVLTNISLDHFKLEELHKIFEVFISQACAGVVLNADCPQSLALRSAHPNVRTFGRAADADFSLERLPMQLKLAGAHNLQNALAAIAACSFLNIEPAASIEALASFGGIRRRLETVGSARGVRVLDDFASNPGKIGAVLQTLQADAQRVIAIFQPHGFYPTKMMREAYIETFTRLLRSQDLLLMPEIYYAGGSANSVDGSLIALPTDISSKDIVVAIQQSGKQAHYFQDRRQILNFVAQEARPGDSVVVMGSRDESLSDFAREIFARVQAE